MAVFLKGLSEKFSSSRKSKCSLSMDEVWKKAFVLTFHYDPSYLYHSGPDSILLSQVLPVPVRTASEVPHWDQILPAPPSYSCDSPPGFPLDSPTSVQILIILAFAFFPPPTSHPSRWSQSPGLSSMSHTANSDWLSILYMLTYMFPCYPFHSPHPLLPTHYPVSVGLFSMSSYPLLPYK